MKLEINIKNESNYPIYIEKGSLKKISKFITFSQKNLLLTDDGVPKEYIEKILNTNNNICICVIPMGEKSKSFENYEKVLNILIENEFCKSDLLIALGGGVVGDLGGFVAGTYKRGMRFINVPTTSLAMVDSSIGGKNGINFSGIKNSIGSFYNPEMVIIDIEVLKTLSNRHLLNGLVEAIKSGLIGDEKLFSIFKRINCGSYENLEPYLEEIIVRSLNVKKKLVEEDLYDSSMRRLLNFGHTYGHAIESINMDKILHGEAVALGMLTVLNEDIKKELLEVFNNLGIELNLDLINNEEIYKKIIQDKKVNEEKINLVKVDTIGKAYIEEVELKKIR